MNRTIKPPVISVSVLVILEILFRTQMPTAFSALEELYVEMSSDVDLCVLVRLRSVLTLRSRRTMLEQTFIKTLVR
jgi:hypothetical protein